MKNKSLLLSIFILSTFVVSGVFAKPHKARSNDIKRLVKNIFVNLDVTEEQKQEIKSFVQSAKENRKKQQAEPDSYHSQMQEFLNNSRFDEEKARQLITFKQENRITNQVERLKLKHSIMQVLTQQQREHLQKLKYQSKSLKESNN
ncbi:MAG: Spy/CpxP family protein refolding chaperone [Pseudomonadota bacterium]